MIRVLRKWWKKKKLIEKYTPTNTVLSIIADWSKDDKEWCNWWKFQIECRIRCLRRLKKL